MRDVVIFLLIHQPVFLSVSETWLNEDTMFHLDAAKTIGYAFSGCNRQGRGGGEGIFVSEYVSFKNLNSGIPPDLK